MIKIFFQDIITTGYADYLKSRCLNRNSYVDSKKSEYIWKRYNSTGMLSLIFEETQIVRVILEHKT